MLVAYFSPLAPAFILLLSAFILSIVIFRLPARWQTHRGIQYFYAPGWVILAGLVLLGTRLTLGQDTTGQGLQYLSGWNFTAPDSGAALAVRADELSLPFLILTILFLLVVMLASLPLTKDGKQGWGLTLGATACLLFVAANGLTQAYAILIFDSLAALYWLKHRRTSLAVAQLFLGILTANALILQAGLASSNNGESGLILLGFALWLRLGLYPFIEARIDVARSDDYESLIYWGLGLTVGLYLAIRTLTGPLPEIMRWLAVVTILLNGLLLWLSEAASSRRTGWLVRLALSQALVILIVPLPASIAIAFVVGLVLSFTTLWVTPQLGKPRLNEAAWSWPYLPAIAATLCLIGLPFTLNWPVWSTIYPTLFSSGHWDFAIFVALAVTLALSALARYWLMPGQGPKPTSTSHHRNKGVLAAAAIVAAVPFLIPGLAPLILATMMETESPAANPGEASPTLIVIAATAIGAISLGYFKPRILEQLKISSQAGVDIVHLQEMFEGLVGELLNQLGKLLLRVNAILEGQHYLGWALFTALVAGIIILLQI